MNTKGVEDGMSDEQICGNCFNREGEHTAEDQCIDDRGHLLGTEWKPILSATNEELIEQGQNLAKNYKPGPRQAVPFMPKKSLVSMNRGVIGLSRDGWATERTIDADKLWDLLDPQPAVPVEERTASMEDRIAALEAALKKLYDETRTAVLNNTRFGGGI